MGPSHAPLCWLHVDKTSNFLALNKITTACKLQGNQHHGICYINRKRRVPETQLNPLAPYPCASSKLPGGQKWSDYDNNMSVARRFSTISHFAINLHSLRHRIPTGTNSFNSFDTTILPHYPHLLPPRVLQTSSLSSSIGPRTETPPVDSPLQ